MGPRRPDGSGEGRNETTPGGTPGVVVAEGGWRWFFPGGSYEIAMMLARASLPPDVLGASGTRIEWGQTAADGRTWLCEKKMKVPTGPAEPEPPTRTPRPGDAEYGWG